MFLVWCKEDEEKYEENDTISEKTTAISFEFGM